jgi:membrane fusion protein (multidrug efflux system)
MSRGAFMLSPSKQRSGCYCSSSFTLLLLVTLVAAGCGEKKEAAAPAPPDVDVVVAAAQDVPIYNEWISQLNGVNNAEITPKVQGYLLRQNYKDGFFVHKNDVLFELDARPSQAALDAANAQLAVVRANLARAQNDVARDTPLSAQEAIPQKQLENDIANVKALTAGVEAAQAQVEQAQLNLGWTKVRSPIEGIAGKAASQVGELVGTTTKMTTVSQVNPMRAYFSISETAFLKIAPNVAKFIRGGDNQTIKGLPGIEFIQSNGEVYPEKGHLVLVNREVSTQTGTIELAGEFENRGSVLRPGGFGRVRIQTGMHRSAVLVPQRAVQEVQSMYQAVVVDPNNKASFRPIKVGERIGDQWIITDGIKPGDRVVTQGFMKLKEGSVVNPKANTETASASGTGSN